MEKNIFARLSNIIAQGTIANVANSTDFFRIVRSCRFFFKRALCASATPKKITR